MNHIDPHSDCRLHWLLIFPALCCLLLSTQVQGAANVYAGSPARLLSGDRLIFIAENGERHRLRLMGIKTAPPKQATSADAMRYLGSLVMGRSLTFKYRITDGDGYLVGNLFHGGADINIRMIQAGLAVHDPFGQPVTDQIRYAEAQRKAQQMSLGIWNRDAGRPQLGPVNTMRIPSVDPPMRPDKARRAKFGNPK